MVSERELTAVSPSLLPSLFSLLRLREHRFEGGVLAEVVAYLIEPLLRNVWAKLPVVLHHTWRHLRQLMDVFHGINQLFISCDIFLMLHPIELGLMLDLLSHFSLLILVFPRKQQALVSARFLIVVQRHTVDRLLELVLYHVAERRVFQTLLEQDELSLELEVLFCRLVKLLGRLELRHRRHRLRRLLAIRFLLLHRFFAAQLRRCSFTDEVLAQVRALFLVLLVLRLLLPLVALRLTYIGGVDLFN